MKKIITICLLLILSVFINPCNADVQESGIELVDLTFEQAYQLMLENNNALKAYNELIEQSKYEKRATLGEFSPKVILNSTYIHFSEDMQLSTPINIFGFTHPTAFIFQNQEYKMAVWHLSIVSNL